MKFTYRMMALVCLLFSVIAHAKDPLLVVLLMVKNEREVIIPTLETYILKDTPPSGDIGYILYDTGSTDGTETIAQNFFKEKGLQHFLVTQEPWVDFITSRNKALALARQTYPQSTFILFPDAEWYLNDIEKLLSFCQEEAERYKTGSTPPPYYRLDIVEPSGRKFVTPRLFLTQDDVIFEGPLVHECPTKCSSHSAPKDIIIAYRPSRTGSEKSYQRWHRDRELLQKYLIEYPTDPRAAYYLGQTEFLLGNLPAAYNAYKRRTELSAFPEEDWSAQYYLGYITSLLAEQDPAFTWHEALSHYLKAYNMRPWRAEPLINIAQHYLDENNHELCYIFARRACDLPFPEREILPIAPHPYDFTRWEILSRCAWYVKEYTAGEYAAKQAIEAQPNEPHLYRNLSFYWDKKNT